MLEGDRHLSCSLYKSERERKFLGPVFIIGMPRSGTKLLRDLLNQHSEVGIPPSESHFIPYYYRKWVEFGDLREPRNFNAFYRHMSRSGFFQTLQKKNEAIDRDIWYREVKDWSYAGIIRGLFCGYARMKGKRISGDKTPSYMTQIPLLSQLFPEARFIHILRDPRDYCASVRAVWGKNVFRAAQRWSDDVRKCRSDAVRHLENCYLEVKYENLITNPQVTMINICQFLSIRFEKRMLMLDQPTEDLGDAKGAVHIVRANTGKWEQKLRPSEINTIERITGAAMFEVGYASSSHGRGYRLSRWQMAVYKGFDGIHLFFHYVNRNRNLWKTLRWIVLERIYTGYRNRWAS